MWILDGPRSQAAGGHGDPDRGLIPAFVRTSRPDAADGDDMETMEALIAGMPENGPRIVAAIAAKDQVILGVLLAAQEGLDLPPLLVPVQDAGFVIDQIVQPTSAELADHLGMLTEPIPTGHQVAVVIYEMLGLPASRLRRYGLHRCPIPDLRHACFDDYFACAHEAAYIETLPLLRARALMGLDDDLHDGVN